MSTEYKLDCSGLVCPRPVAMTKRKMLEMNSGEILEIVGDFYEAGKNIQRYAENHDGKVLEFTEEGQNYYIKIQKL